jgi:hypothetical protein
LKNKTKKKKPYCTSERTLHRNEGPCVLTPISKLIQAFKGMLLSDKRVKSGLQQRNGASSEQMRAVFIYLFGPAYSPGNSFAVPIAQENRGDGRSLEIDSLASVPTERSRLPSNGRIGEYHIEE